MLAHGDPVVRGQALEDLRRDLPAAQAALVDRHAAGWVTLQPGWGRLAQARELLATDFAAVWRAVRCPVLALNGDKDVQVPATANLQAIAAALKAGASGSAHTILLPGINHMLQTGGTGLEDEYARIDEAVAPAVLEALLDFILSVAPGPRARP